MFILFIAFSLNAQWIPQKSGVSSSLVSVSAVDDNVCWICGDSGIILRNSDGGSTWDNMSSSGIGTNSIENLFALDSNNCLAAVSYAMGTFVYKTTNGSTTCT